MRSAMAGVLPGETKDPRPPGHATGLNGGGLVSPKRALAVTKTGPLPELHH
jgi:hypothetical protein